MKVSFRAGKLLTAGAWQDGKVVFSIHNAKKDQGDTVKPDPKTRAAGGEIKFLVNNQPAVKIPISQLLR